MHSHYSRLEKWISVRWASKSEFARQSGISPQQLSEYLKGNKRPGGEMLEKWATLGLNIHWYLTGLGEMDAPSHQITEPIFIVQGAASVAWNDVVEVLRDKQIKITPVTHLGPGTIDTVLDVIEKKLDQEDPERRTRKGGGEEEVAVGK